MRAWLRRLERASSEEMIKIPQRDGSTAKFRQSDLWEAYLNTCERLGPARPLLPYIPCRQPLQIPAMQRGVKAPLRSVRTTG